MSALTLEHAAVAVVARNVYDPRPLAAIDRLPHELLSKCLTGFVLDDLLPLRLVSKTWLAAVNDQDVYSRDIDYWPTEASLHHCARMDVIAHRPISLDLLRARLNCSTRNVRLRICTRCLPDTDTEAVVELIARHLQRMEVLWIGFLAGLWQSVFGALQRPVTLLRDLNLDVAHIRETCSVDYGSVSDPNSQISLKARAVSDPSGSSGPDSPSDNSESGGSDSEAASARLDPEPESEPQSGLPPSLDPAPSESSDPAPALDPASLPELPARASAVRVPPGLFAGIAPQLQKLSLANCSLDPHKAYPAFSGVGWLKLCAASQDCVGPAQVLALCPRLKSLDITIHFGHTFQPFAAPHATVPMAAPLSARLDVGPQEQLDHLLATLTSAAAPRIIITSLYSEPVTALFGHLRGLGPLTFRIDTDEQRDFVWTQMALVSESKGRVRAVEIHEYDFWEWESEELRMLEFFETAGVSAEIDTIHVTHRYSQWGASNLDMLGGMWGQWPAVRTVRVDIYGRQPSLEKRPWESFPELE
ncbi:hypothetical protein AURDEDRAFT_123683 [Auricularia subglabra TFB-10046 SS5]|nr:hypothetical protein AURDEDRAFT_123683 [Auricularia subglabra TFB-10046 SS5]